MIAIEFMIRIERTLIKIFLPVRDCKIPQLGPGPLTSAGMPQHALSLPTCKPYEPT
jgi:hypothetical protein